MQLTGLWVLACPEYEVDERKVIPIFFLLIELKMLDKIVSNVRLDSVKISSRSM